MTDTKPVVYWGHEAAKIPCRTLNSKYVRSDANTPNSVTYSGRQKAAELEPVRAAWRPFQRRVSPVPRDRASIEFLSLIDITRPSNHIFITALSEITDLNETEAAEKRWVGVATDEC